MFDVDAFLHWTSAAEEGAWVGLKTRPPRRNRIQPCGSSFGPPCKGNVLKKGSESGAPQKCPPWRVQFWPLYCGKSVEADLISNRCDWNLELGEFYFCAPAFSYVLRTKKKSAFFVILFCSNFQALRPSTPASKPAPRCFSMVSRHWSSRFALRPASNFVSSYKLFVLLQFP